MSKLYVVVITIVIFLALSIVCWCCWLLYAHEHYNKSSSTRTPTANCPPLPETFKETDLIGTWVAKYWGGEGIDTLVLKEDGTYKQIYHDSITNFHYENGGQRWWVEYRKARYLWLHLEGMRRCDDLPEVCEQEGGGTYRDTYDMCEYVEVPQRGEVILVVTGASHETPRGIILRHTRLAGVDYYYAFELEEEGK